MSNTASAPVQKTFGGRQFQTLDDLQMHAENQAFLDAPEVIKVGHHNFAKSHVMNGELIYVSMTGKLFRLDIHGYREYQQVTEC